MGVTARGRRRDRYTRIAGAYGRFVSLAIEQNSARPFAIELSWNVSDWLAVACHFACLVCPASEPE